MTINELKELADSIKNIEYEAHFTGTLGHTYITGKENGKGPSKVQIDIKRSSYGNVPPEGKVIEYLLNNLEEIVKAVQFSQSVSNRSNT